MAFFKNQSNASSISPIESGTGSAFHRLKPFGVSILNPGTWLMHTRSDHPIQKLLEQLRLELATPNGSNVLLPLVPFISFPIIETLKSQRASEMTVELGLETIRFLLEQTMIQSPPRSEADIQAALPSAMWIQLFSIIPKYGFQADFLPKSNVKCTEEMLDHCVTILIALMRILADMPRSFLSISDASLLPIAAHNVMMLLHIMENVKPHQITHGASQSLVDIFRTIDDPEKLVQFLPGTVSKMMKILEAGTERKRHHSLLVDSIEILGTIIPMVLGDEVCQEYVHNPLDVQSLNRQDSEATEKMQTVDSRTQDQVKSSKTTFLTRSQEWFDGTVKQVGLALESMFRNRNHENVHVRRAYLQLIDKLLSRCTLSLQSSRGLLVETICLYVNDSDKELATEADDIFIKMRTENSTTSPWVANAVESRLRDGLFTLSTGVSNKPSVQANQQLQLICSLLTTCERDIKPVLGANMDLIIDELISLTKFSKDSQIQMITDHHRSQSGQMDLASRIQNTRIDSIEQLYRLFPRKAFVHLLDDELIQNTEKLLRLIGYHCEPTIMIPRLIERIHDCQEREADDDGLTVASLLYITNQILLGMSGCEMRRITHESRRDQKNAQTETDQWALTVIREYLNLKFLSEPSNISSPYMLLLGNSSTSYTMRDYYRVTLTTNLVLEGLAFATSLLSSPRSVSIVLMDALYPILEKVSDSNHIIQNSAELALASLSRSYFTTFSESPASAVPIHSLLSESASQDTEPTIRNLVLRNVDYLIESVSQRLQMIQEYPYLPSVLLAAVKMTGSDLIGPLMVDTVDQLFDVVDDLGTSGYLESVLQQYGKDEKCEIGHANEMAKSYGHHLLDQIFAVFQALLETMPVPHPFKSVINCGPTLIQQSDCPEPKKDVSSKRISPEILAFQAKYGKRSSNNQNILKDESDRSKSAQEYFESKLREMAKKTKEEQEKEKFEDAAKDHEADEPDTTDPSQTLTPYESLSLSILQKCLDFLRSDSAWIRARVLRMIAVGLVQLHSKSKELLPLIHACWSPIISRCKDNEHFVILEALNVIRVISELSTDFVRKRVSDDLFPKMGPLFTRLHQEVVQEGHSDHHQTSSSVPHKSAAITKREFTVASRHAIALHQSKIIMSSFRTLEMIMEFVPVSTKDAVMFVDCLIPFLNEQIYTEPVRNAVENILVIMCKGNMGDWVWANLFVALGAKSFCTIDKTLYQEMRPLNVPHCMRTRRSMTDSPYLGSTQRILNAGLGVPLDKTDAGYESGICIATL